MPKPLVIPDAAKQAIEFIKFWFSHPNAGDKIRLIYFGSDYQKQTFGVVRKKGEAPKEQSLVRERVRVEPDVVLDELVKINMRGNDVYYFCNVVRADFGEKEGEKNATNKDIARRLFLPLDIDFRLPCSIGELESELGLKFSAVVKTSEREFPHYQLLLEIESNEDETTLGFLARSFCNILSSDQVGDAKRILRLPGLLNWKGVDVGGIATRAEFISGDIAAAYHDSDAAEAFAKFEKSALAKEMAALRLEKAGTRVHVSGANSNGSSHFPRWIDAFNKAEVGEWSVGAGDRHNALLVWGGQMSNENLPLPNVLANLDFLAAEGCEGNYATSQPADYAKVRRDVERKFHAIDAEKVSLALSVEEFLELPFSTEEYAEYREKTAEEDPTGRIDKPETLDFGPIATGPESLLEFAKQSVSQLKGEREGQWLWFLGDILNAVNLFSAADMGSICSLCDVFQRRLGLVGALRRGVLYGPVVSSEEKGAWSMAILSQDEAINVVRHLFFSAETFFKDEATRRKVGKMPNVLKAQEGQKKPKKRFSAKGPILVQYQQEMMLRWAGKIQLGHEKRLERAGSCQNGTFDLVRWQQICDEANELTDATGRIGEIFKRNDLVAPGVLNSRASWIRGEQCATTSFGLSHGGTLAYGGGGTDVFEILENIEELRTPIFDAYLTDCFGDDREARRGIYRAIAYCLLPENPLQIYFFFEGIAGSGKGVLARLLTCMMGERKTDWVDKDRMRSDAWLGPLEGKNIAIIDEAEELDPRDLRSLMGKLAKLTGGDIHGGRNLFGDSRQIRGGWKFILMANELPEIADKSGQQERRVVPVYFPTRKEKSKVIVDLHRIIYRAEGDRIYTKAMHEYLLNGFRAGNTLFEIDSPTFTEGKKRFEQSTAGIRGVLKLGSRGARNMPKMLTEAVVDIWIGRKESRKYLARGLDRAITAEMAVLGFQESRKARMPWPGTGVGGERGDLLKGYLGYEFDTAALLDELEMMPEELAMAIKERCVGKKKLWRAAKALLDLPDSAFAAAESRAFGQQPLFDVRDIED